MKALDGSKEGLCRTCKTITLEHLLRPEGFSHLSSARRLLTPDEGCRLCALISRSIGDVFSNDMQNRWLARSKLGHPGLVTILLGARGPNNALDHILVCCGDTINVSNSGKDQSLFPPGTDMVGRIEVATKSGEFMILSKLIS